MAKQETHKAKNTTVVILFIAWCVALYIALQTGPTGFWERVQTTFSDLRVKDGLALVMAPVIALIGTGLLSATTKASLVFWRFRHVLPGHRAFSHWAKTDPRVDVDKLKQKLGELPREPTKQNTTWYALFKQHEASPTVSEAHRNFLLARDLAAVALLFGVFGGIALLVVQRNVKWSLLYSVAMALHYLVLAIVARNHGNALVCNVLADHSTSP